MSELKEKVTFYLSALLYLLFNLRLGEDAMTTARATVLQILQTAPYIIGFTIFIVTFLQYAAGGRKMPWERRLRVFFALGIMGGLIFAIFEYTGQGGVFK